MPTEVVVNCLLWVLGTKLRPSGEHCFLLLSHLPSLRLNKNLFYLNIIGVIVGLILIFLCENLRAV